MFHNYEKKDIIFLGRMYFTDQDSYKNILVFPPSLVH